MGYRVAILLSGQSRSYKIALDSITQFFECIKKTRQGEDIYVDYFFHTWDTNQWTEKGSDKMRLNEIEYEPAEVDIDFIKSKINLIDYEIETYDLNRFNVAWGGPLYSFYKSNHIKRKYELRNGFKYDLVVKTRFDIAYYVPGRFGYINPPVRQFLYTTTGFGRIVNEFNSFNFDDVWFYADSQTIDFISNLYNYVGEQIGNNHMKTTIGQTFHLTESLLGPGCLLNRFANKINIQAAQEPGQLGSYIVIRKSALGKNLHAVNDFAELQNLNKEYYDN